MCILCLCNRLLFHCICTLLLYSFHGFLQLALLFIHVLLLTSILLFLGLLLLLLFLFSLFLFVKCQFPFLFLIFIKYLNWFEYIYLRFLFLIKIYSINSTNLSIFYLSTPADLIIISFIIVTIQLIFYFNWSNPLAIKVAFEM